jgi:O-antigen/teichoic acid export membrane protein
MANRLLPQFYTLVISIAAARFLGPDDFGRQSFIAFVAISATSFFSGGLKLALMRYVGELLGREEGPAARGLVGWTASLQVVGAALGGSALIATGALGAEPSAAWMLAGLWTATAVMQTIPFALLLGAQRFKIAAQLGMITDTIALPSTIAVLAAGGGITGIFAVQAAVGAGNLIVTTVLARRVMGDVAPSKGPSPHRWRRPLLRFAALSTGGVVLELVVWRRSEFFFLDHYSTDAQIGLYSIAFGAVLVLTLIPQTLASVIAPAFATLFGAGERRRMRSGYGRAMRLLLLGSLPLAAGALALGPELIRLLYGEQFSGAGTVLVVMLLLFPLLPLNSVSLSLLTGMGRAAVPFVIGSVAAVVNIGLAFALIPLWDAIGAALANAGAQFAAVVPSFVYASRLIGGVNLHPGSLVRTALAAGAAGLVAWAMLLGIGGIAGFAAGAALWLATFGAMAAALRILPADDAAWLEGVAGGRFGGAVGWACRRAARRSPALAEG